MTPGTMRLQALKWRSRMGMSVLGLGMLLMQAVALPANGRGASAAAWLQASASGQASVSAPEPRVATPENDTPEVRELMRRRSEAVDPVAWAIQMATGVPIEEQEIAPGVFARAEARSPGDFTIVWRLAPGVDTSAVKIFRPEAADRMRVSTPEFVGSNATTPREWLAADDAGVSALPATGAGGAEIRAQVIVPLTNYSVSNTNDSGAGSLRQALIDANAAVGGTHVITISATGTINLLSALPAIDNISVSINGPGAASLTINRSSGGSYSIFQTPNILYSRAYGFSGMRIQNGAGQVGGVSVTGGTLTISQCVFANNVGSFFSGGLGVFSSTTTITRTTFNGNGGIQGAAINAQGSALTISNSTFSGNQGTSTSSDGAAIFHFSNGQAMTLTNCTFSGNINPSNFGGGDALVAQNPASYRNTIFSGQSPQISGGGASSLGNNICSDGSGNLSAAGDLPNTNPLLSALGNNGGQTPTHALLPGSPAINAGTSTGAPSTDQRGIARVGATDIGAFESRGFSMALSSGNNQSTPVNAAFANPLAVTVASANSEPVNGGRVSFTPPGSGASASIAGNPATIASGAATTGTVTANATVGGPYSVAASASGVATGVSFSLTNGALPTLAISDVSLSEGNSGTQTLNFTVTRTGTTTAAAGFNFASANDTATTTDGDYLSASGSGSIAAGGATGSTTVSVTINGDAVFENTERFFVNLSTPTNAQISDAQGIGTLTNDDTAPTLSINDVSLAEGNSGSSNLLFTVTRTGLTALPASFSAATANGTATAPGDYLAALTGSTTIAAGGATGTTTLTATVNGDLVVEPDETFFVNLGAPGGATIADTQGIGTIGNDDVAPTDLAITKTDLVNAETPGSVVTYRIVASNDGPAAVIAATVSDSFPAGLSACTWRCIAGSGANCPASGSGNLNATVDLPVAGSVTFHATCLIDAGASGTLTNTASVAMPVGGTDPNPANNSAGDSDTLDAVLPERTPANWSLISSGTPSARSQSGMAHDPVSGLTLVFGGVGTGFLNDLHRYQPSTGWTLVDPGVTRPSGRHSFGFAAGNGSFYLHAGVASSGETSDFWRYTPGSGWTQLDPGAAAGPTHPGPRLGASGLFDPVRNRFVFFGGRRTGQPTNETWAFQFPGNTWVQLDAGGGSSAVPAARENHNLVYDPNLDAYLLFGGARNGGIGDPHYNDVWLYTPGSGWSLRDPGGVAGPDRPTRRNQAAMAYDPLRQRHILHGGSDIITLPQVFHNNTWEYDAAANRWRELMILTPMPTLAASSAFAFDTTINRLVIANGRNTSNAHQSQTYELGIVVPLELSIADMSVVEGNSGTTTLNFTVALTTPALAGGVGFDIATADAVATAPADYTARTLTGQSIAQGQSSASFAVTVSGDSAVEPDEILRVVVSNVTGATLVDGDAIGTILTDDFRTLSINDTGKITCMDNTVTPTGTVSPATPDPEGAGFNEQDCTRGASAADALGVLYKQGGSSQPGRDYTKIANDGSELPNSATLGSAPGDWACTRDNSTGLMWEVKTDDNGLRDKDHRYTWYEPDANRNGGNAGSTGSDSCAGTLPGGLCNMQAYRTAVNALSGGSRLCGATDWRLPDISELHTLIHYGVPISDPSIDTTWFPNSISSTGGANFNGFYWSRETNAKFPQSGWGVYFSALYAGGYVESFDKTALRHVRLVRGGQ